MLARIANRSLDPERTKYVHLLDGGIADNLALRSVVNGGIALDETSDTFRRVALKARRIIRVHARHRRRWREIGLGPS